MSIKVAIGTMNPAKIGGVKKAFLEVWQDKKFTFENFSVNSGVSAQPMDNEETIRGAINRAKEALKLMDGDYGVGLEGGVFNGKYGVFLNGWVAVIDKSGICGIGGGCSLQLPNFIAKRIIDGEELGPVMDEITGEFMLKHRDGSVGFFTGGVVKREDSFKRMTIYALAKFIRSDFYKK